MEAAGGATPVTHQRPAEGEAHELLGFERVLFWLRVVGVGVLLTQAPLYALIAPWIPLGAAILTLATAIAQRVALHEDLPLPAIRRRAGLFLASDLVSMYVMGTAFTPDAGWIAFYYYPLLSLEATLIAGTTAGLAVTVLSVVVYAAQLALHVAYGHPVDTRAIVGAITLIGMTGGFMAVFGLLAVRGRRDLRVLLDLGAALQQQQDESAMVTVLDRRVHDAVGGRVRCVVVLDDEGGAESIRWHSPERAALRDDDVEAALGPVAALRARFAAGVALTLPADAGSPVTSSLGLPDWARAITLVPIVLEARWVGVLPVLWPVARVPTRHELRLLYGIAGHVGLALAQGQLQRARAEAATDPLTGLLNRRAITEELTSFLARASRAEAPMAVLFCDLDGFKAVNDERGHEAGDAILAAVATAVRGALRLGDVVGRYGGDELLIVAADAAAGDAVALAHRVRDAVRSVGEDADIDVTIGIGAYPDDGRTNAELMVAADQAMYRGKLRGRGRVMVADEEQRRPAAGAG